MAFVLGGAFEVIDNLLGLRTLNFESSAPAIFKVAKEAAIGILLIGIARIYGVRRLSYFGIGVSTATFAAFIPAIVMPPSESFAQIGLAYLCISILMLQLTCLLSHSGMEMEFKNNFLLPVLVVTLTTQLMEAWLAPESIYFESNLLGLDRRAGIAVIPTTAGLLGIVGFSLARGLRQLLGLLVITMANSTLSLMCLMIVLLARMRSRNHYLLGVPIILALSFVSVVLREGLDTSLSSRLSILNDSLTQLAWFGPSTVGALATAKSVALAPFDSFIADSLYIELFHVFGIVPGVILIISLMASLYRRVGGSGALIFAIAALGYLALEAWPVWLAIVTGLQGQPYKAPSYAADSNPGTSDSRPQARSP